MAKREGEAPADTEWTGHGGYSTQNFSASLKGMGRAGMRKCSLNAFVDTMSSETAE